jgi:hypothetical protein
MSDNRVGGTSGGASRPGPLARIKRKPGGAKTTGGKRQARDQDNRPRLLGKGISNRNISRKPSVAKTDTAKRPETDNEAKTRNEPKKGLIARAKQAFSGRKTDKTSTAAARSAETSKKAETRPRLNLAGSPGMATASVAMAPTFMAMAALRPDGNAGKTEAMAQGQQAEPIEINQQAIPEQQLRSTLGELTNGLRTATERLGRDPRISTPEAAQSVKQIAQTFENALASGDPAQVNQVMKEALPTIENLEQKLAQELESLAEKNPDMSEADLRARFMYEQVKALTLPQTQEPKAEDLQRLADNMAALDRFVEKRLTENVPSLAENPEQGTAFVALGPNPMLNDTALMQEINQLYDGMVVNDQNVPERVRAARPEGVSFDNGVVRITRPPRDIQEAHAPRYNPQQAAQMLQQLQGTATARLADALDHFYGMSSKAGPDGGNLACAWAVNKILERVLGFTLGSNTNLVSSVEDALKALVSQGRAVEVPASQAPPGAIITVGRKAGGGAHIGIMGKDGLVLSNSSSKASFTWRATTEELSSRYEGEAKAYVLL